MSIKICAVALPLVLWQGLALAHVQAEPDPECKWPTAVQKRQIAPGRIAIMSVKNPGNKDCSGPGDCTNEVEVQSFTRANGEAACCTRVEWGSLTAVQGNQPQFKWSIKSLDGKRYVFNPIGIHIIMPPIPTPADMDAPKYPGNGTDATIKSNNKAKTKRTFNYGVSVSLELGRDEYLACDLNDPIIVNAGD